MSKYGVFSGRYFPVFSPNIGKYGPEKSPYLDTFHAVYVSFACNPTLEVRDVFLDVSKAFGRVLHERFIYKTKWMAVKGDLLTLIESFLFERQQRVVLNGQESGNQIWCASGCNYLVHYFLKVY